MTHRRFAGAPLLLFFVSGSCGLAYQILWTRLIGLHLGHELPAVLAVLAAFFSGLAVGARLSDHPRFQALPPARLLALLECVIGAWAMLSIWLIPRVIPTLLPEDVAMGPATLGGMLLGPLLCIGPGAIAMGATLPVMIRWWEETVRSPGARGAVYAANTAGTVAGIPLAIFLTMPALGLPGSVLVFAGLNAFCAAGAWWLGRAAIATPSRVEAAGTLPISLKTRLLFTGLAGLGYEVLGIRVLSQSLENTLYTYALALAVLLLGTSAGAAAASAALRRGIAGSVALWFGITSLAFLIGGTGLRHAPAIYAKARSLLGDNAGAVIFSEMLAAAAGFLLPSLALGALFTFLLEEVRRHRAATGRAVAWNTWGGGAAPLVIGFLVLPKAGFSGTLLILAGLLLGMGGLVWRRWSWSIPVLVVIVGMLSGRKPMVVLDTPPAGRVLSQVTGRMETVAVVETQDGHRSLLVNNRFVMGGTGARLAARRHAHIPLLLHPGPERALFLGVGTGITVGGTAPHPGLEVDAVELVPEILDHVGWFEPRLVEPAKPEGMRLHAADARRFVRTPGQDYDVIVADVFHPARDGAGFLYTREHFQSIRRRLREGGLFCQWLPIYQLDAPLLRSVIRTFQEVFPHSRAWVVRYNLDTPVLGLIGTLEPWIYPSDWMESRVSHPMLEAELGSVSLNDIVSLLGHCVADAESLARYSEGGALNTDEFPIVLFQGPSVMYRRQEDGGALLLEFLQEVSNAPEFLVAEPDSPAGAALVERLRNHTLARNHFLQGLWLERERRLEEAVLAFVESARVSPDFQQGFARCLVLVGDLATRDPARARQLIDKLEAVRPGHPALAALRKRLP